MRDPLTPLRHGFGIHYLQIIFKLAVNGLLSQLWFHVLEIRQRFTLTDKHDLKR